MQVGTIVRLRKYCLGNPEGTLGVVFYNYGDGFQTIFANGKYDGFSTKIRDGFYVNTIPKPESDFFLQEIGFEPLLANYKFENVNKVSRDFESGLFDCVFSFMRGKKWK